MKAGIFDSGIGGLSVLKSIVDARLFDEIIYYGDTARVPYGTKDKDTIVRFSLEALDFFDKHNIDILIVACNTASAYALKSMQKVSRIPVVGVVAPGILALSNKMQDKNKNITNMNGFIGGSSCIIDNKFILFGDSDKLNSKSKLVDFLNKQKLELIDFKNLEIIDYGGVILT